MSAKALAMRQWLAIAGAVVLAGSIGFVTARLTVSEPAASPPETRKQVQPDEVKVSPADLAANGIVTEMVTRGSFDTTITAPAMVDAEIRGEAVIAAQVAGTVIRIAKRLGDRATAGEALAFIESRDAAALAAARDIAESRLKLAESALSREKNLYDQMVTPRQDLERAQSDVETAEAEARRAQAAADAAHLAPDGKTVAVISPLSGTVTSRSAALGLFVQPQTELFRVSDPRFIDVDAAVPALDAQRISPGDPAKLVTRSGMEMRGVVRSITPTVDERTRSATVVIDPLPNQPALAPGELVQVEISTLRSAASGFVVPEEAVQNIEGRNVVFVRTATGFKLRPVVAGSRGAGKVSILSGLNAGESIATVNAFFLKAELMKGSGEDE
jgi:membrane fusion protein, heavy metal efflux system